MKIAFITGATAGIGRAIALRFARGGISVIITGRRQDRLKKLADEIHQTTPARALPLRMDVKNLQDVEETFRYLPEEWQSIEILVNNAGLALGLDPFQHGNFRDWEEMIDTNIKGLLYVTRTCVQGMLRRNSGLIINIGSLAGRDAYPGGNVYCATKAAVDAFTRGLRMDLLGTGIRVTQLAPGLTETEFSTVRFKGDHERAARVYQGYTPLKPEDIAEIAWFIATLPPHVCVQDILVTPSAQATSVMVHKKG